jgi:hypothetical protein
MNYWKYKDKLIKDIKDIPEGVFGFVYLISKTTSPEYYIGRKNLYSTRKLQPLKGYKRKRTVIKESNWLTYMSSNEQVKQWDKCNKIILYWAFNKKQLTYFENKALYCYGVLEDKNSHNANIAGKFFKEEFMDTSSATNIKLSY